MNTEEKFTVTQAAAYLGVSCQRLYALRCENSGPVSWVEGGRLVYPKVELDRYRQRQRRRSLRGEGLSERSG
jgi:hypothetical protein